MSLKKLLFTHRLATTPTIILIDKESYEETITKLFEITKISNSERIRSYIKELFSSRRPLSQVYLQGVQVPFNGGGSEYVFKVSKNFNYDNKEVLILNKREINIIYDDYK